MPTILHIVEGLFLGGALRSALAAAKYSARLGGYSHKLIPLMPSQPTQALLDLAMQSNVDVVVPTSQQAIYEQMAASDIVMLEWWNSPHMAEFLRGPLPAVRLGAWMHVGGHEDPQRIPDELVNFLDYAVACSPHTYEAPAFSNLDPAVRQAKTAMAYDGTDFERIKHVVRREHSGFNVGYIGTVNFMKMHRNYVRMSAAARIPDARFIVCGHGGDHFHLQQDARELGVEQRFSINDTVADISPILEVMDVFGYPLCEDTYAAGELCIQEVMYCGIPPVVFPYGGLRRLVVNDYTGYIVNSELEYSQALEYLYNHPQERARLGRNAAEYARQIFGAEPAARKLNTVYEQLMNQPKRTRAPFGSKPPVWLPQTATGVQTFLDYLGPTRGHFEQSMRPSDRNAALEADALIMKVSHLMKRSGIKSYRNFYPTDPYLCFWSGLASLGEGNAVEAMHEIVESLKHGFTGWRPWWFLAQAAQQAGSNEIAKQALTHVLSEAGDFEAAQELNAVL